MSIFKNSKILQFLIREQDTNSPVSWLCYNSNNRHDCFIYLRKNILDVAKKL